jgi:hypothetical protein
MSSDTAELAIAGAARERAAGAAAPRSGPLRALRSRARAIDVAGVRDCWRALWTSHLLAYGAGLVAVASFGYGPQRNLLSPAGLTRGLGAVGNLLVAPVARWDSSWYLVIARYGYRPDLAPYTNARTAYFPLYPLGIRTLSFTGLPFVLAGVLLSGIAFALALYGIHRLAALELRRSSRLGAAPGIPRLAVFVTAFAPLAFVFTAVYSESLFLALSVGMFWSARHGRWAWAGVLGALAGATRSTGLVLILPALLLYLYGPREDRPPDRTPAPPAPPAPPDAAGDRAAAATGSLARARSSLPTHRARVLRALRPRYLVRRDVLWLALLPVGVAVYGAWLGLSGGDVLGPFHAEQAWSRHLVGPFVGAWDGVKAGFEGARQLLSFQRSHVYFPAAGGDPFVAAGHNLLNVAFLLAAVVALVGVARRLPAAYLAYALAAIALPLSYPVAPQPLMSIPRYLVVLFPLAIWLAAWLAEHPRLQRPALAASLVAMAFFEGQFATWHWVA